jgi:hypothetical protein
MKALETNATVFKAETKCTHKENGVISSGTPKLQFFFRNAYSLLEISFDCCKLLEITSKSLSQGHELLPTSALRSGTAKDRVSPSFKEEDSMAPLWVTKNHHIFIETFK